jgi:hypothetical protein
VRRERERGRKERGERVTGGGTDVNGGHHPPPPPNQTTCRISNHQHSRKWVGRPIRRSRRTEVRDIAVVALPFEYGRNLQCQPVRGSDHPRGMPLVTRMAALKAEQRRETQWHPRVQICVQNRAPCIGPQSPKGLGNGVHPRSEQALPSGQQ